MEYKKEKIKIKKILVKYPMINLPSIARLLKVPLSKARLISFDLELERFLIREEVKVNTNIQRFWKLVENTNKKETGKKNENGIRKSNTAWSPHT